MRWRYIGPPLLLRGPARGRRPRRRRRGSIFHGASRSNIDPETRGNAIEETAGRVQVLRSEELRT